MEKKDIENLATLSRIEMTDEELKNMAQDFDSILGYVTQIQEVVTETGEETPAVGLHHNVMREDENPHAEKEYTEAMVKNMPDSERGYLTVKKIL